MPKPYFSITNVHSQLKLHKRLCSKRKTNHSTLKSILTVLHSPSLHFYRPLLPFNTLILLYSPLPPSIPLLIFNTLLLSSFHFLIPFPLNILHHCLCLHVPSFFVLSFIAAFGFTIFLSLPLSYSPNFMFHIYPFS
jgi:hypothetical protein